MSIGTVLAYLVAVFVASFLAALVAAGYALWRFGGEAAEERCECADLPAVRS